MNKHFHKPLILTLLLTAVLLSFQAPTALADISAAITYLQAQSDNPWITMALIAAGESPSADYLKSTNVSSAIDLAAPILAITAVGEDPRTFPDTNLVDQMQGYYSGGQLGDSSILNDDIFGLLALLSAGEALDDEVVVGTKDYILSKQNADGGWGFSAGGGSDTNITSVTIMTLLEAGVSSGDSVIQDALLYIEAAQNPDGGFPYDPLSPWGTDSDASSDAWIVSAIEATGGSLSDFFIAGVGGPLEHLLSLQAPEGYFQYQDGTGEDAFSSITTSYAVVALSGRFFPVNTITYTPPDTTAPVITLTGTETIDLKVGSEFTEPGYTATDDTDGDITNSVVVGGSNVNTDQAGTYTITYNVSDGAGNSAQEQTRTVMIFEREDEEQDDSNSGIFRTSAPTEDEEEPEEQAQTTEEPVEEPAEVAQANSEDTQEYNVQEDAPSTPSIPSPNPIEPEEEPPAELENEPSNITASVLESAPEGATELPTVLIYILLVIVLGQAVYIVLRRL